MKCDPIGASDEATVIWLEDVPDIQSWMHLTLSAKYVENGVSETYMRLDSMNFSKETRAEVFTQLRETSAIYGGGIDLADWDTIPSMTPE